MRARCALAVALLAALVLAACGGSEEAPVATAPPATATTAEPPATDATTADVETEPPATETEPETEPPVTETEPETEPAETEPAETESRFDVDVLIQVADGERIGGRGRVEATKGDRVRIEVVVDAAQDVHVHGYELEKTASPDKPAVFTFRAELEGIFEIESHLKHEVLANLVVEP